MQIKTLLLMVALSILAVGCGHRKDAKKFEKLMEEKTGQSFSIAKLHTETGKFVVYKNDKTGEFLAVDMEKFDRKNMVSIEEFLQIAIVGEDIVQDLSKHEQWIESGYWTEIYETEYYEYDDEDCDCYYEESETYYVGDEWVDTSHWYTYFTGGGFRFENAVGASKDLETLAALKEEVSEKFIASRLKSEFALSANRSQELAKLTTRYQKLESLRELTVSEKDHFAMGALGVTFSSIEKALAQKAEGKEDSYAEMLKKAAQVNSTSSEQIGNFFDQYLAEEFSSGVSGASVE